MKPVMLIALMIAGGGPALDYKYTCEDTPLVVARFSDRAVELRIGTRKLVLPQGRAGSGARYTDGSMVFWIKGNEATLDTGDGMIKQCRVTDRG